MIGRFYAMLLIIFVFGLEMGRYIQWHGLFDFEFRPESFSVGNIILLLFLVILAVYSVATFKRDFLKGGK